MTDTLLCMTKQVREQTDWHVYRSIYQYQSLPMREAVISHFFTIPSSSVHSTCEGMMVRFCTRLLCVRVYSGMKTTVNLRNCFGLTSSGVSTSCPLALPAK